METLEWIRSHALALPNLAKFALAMAILVGVPNVRLLNVVLVLMLSTSILGPMMTARFAPRMLSEKAPETLPSNEANKAV